jgi:TRAP-type mannitol/chloroaromatic compound transport system permease large subunit
VNTLAQYLVPLMLVSLIPLIASGVPVVFSLIACGLLFGGLGVVLGIVPLQLIGALPIRLEFIVANEALLAIPFFTLMGMLLQRSGLAEDLLETAGQVFGAIRGGLAIAVILIGALLAATTGVVAASVISMALISLPAMQRCGYDPRVACGVVATSGTLTQIIPPSLVLIVVAEQLQMPLGDLYAGVLIPAALMISLYVLWILGVAVVRPAWLPAVPAAAASGGGASLGVLLLLSAMAGWLLRQGYADLLAFNGRFTPPGIDESVIVSIGCGLVSAFVLASLERLFGLRWLSPLARRVAFVLVPPLLLIFAVLGSVFLGAATPTESGALGAIAALAVASGRRRLSIAGFRHALLDTVKLSCVIMVLLFAATVFSLSFQALQGTAWVRDLLGDLPGGPFGFLVVVMLVTFVLGMFLDFFELAVILLPIIGPIAEQLGIHQVWFAVLMGINFQTAYLTPPFGFALFYLRGATPAVDQTDKLTGIVRPRISTAQIYWGVVPFIAIQLLVMALVIAKPGLVLGLLQEPPRMDDATVERLIDETGRRHQGSRQSVDR